MKTVIEALGEEITIAHIRYWRDSKTDLYWTGNNGSSLSSTELAKSCTNPENMNGDMYQGFRILQT